MRWLGIAAFAATIALYTTPARSCGGGFGQSLTLGPSQKIVVTHRGAEETYIFMPHFCGLASDFGLILPVPGLLTADPTLASPALYTELDALTAPRIDWQDVCSDSNALGGTGAGGSTKSGSGGVNVVDRGQVGIFQWELLKADTTQSFTDWLDANKFPRTSAADAAFQHYVGAGWYFVAFRVSPGGSAPSGFQLCGDFGPIALSFPAASPVIPARIAGSDGLTRQLEWRVFAVSAHELAAPAAGPTATLRFAGSLTTDVLAANPELARYGSSGEWLTSFDLKFDPTGLSQDIELATAPTDQAYRATEKRVRYVSCGGLFGCSVQPPKRSHFSGTTVALLSGLAALGLGLGFLRRHGPDRRV
jgi:hypothetical protein